MTASKTTSVPAGTAPPSLRVSTVLAVNVVPTSTEAGTDGADNAVVVAALIWRVVVAISVEVAGG